MISFRSCLGPEIQDFLAIREKNCSTSAYAHDRQIMEQLDRYLTKTGCSDKNLSEQTVLGWIATLSGKSSTIANKVIVLRIFLNFLLGYGIHAYVPHIPKVRDDYIPYIFSECEMDDIFREADSLTKGTAVVNGMLHLQMPMILRLMYGCGLRIGETLQLRMEDIDFEQGLLTLRKTKGGKQRLVPMHDSLTDILRVYCCTLVVIKNFLGHASLQTTQIYAQISQNTVDKHLKAWNEKWFPAESSYQKTHSGRQIPDFLEVK